MNELKHFIKDTTSKNILVTPLTKREINYDEYKKKRCVVCKKKGTKEEYGGHVCSQKCENEYSNHIEDGKYFR